MELKVKLTNKYALVTGASIGIGADFSRQLAAMGCNLVLVSRSEDKLQALADVIKATYPVNARVIAMDLGEPGAGELLFHKLTEAGVRIDILVNNAGLGMYGEFSGQSLEQIRKMLRLNIDTLTDLTHLFLPSMLERRYGMIIQVGSLASFMPGPLYAAYSASKAYVLSLGESLNRELKGTGVTCTVVCPGVTATSFFDAAGQNNRYTLYQRLVIMQPADVASIGLDAALKGKPSVLTGFINKLQVFVLRFTPRVVASFMAYQGMKLR
ncbi:MAG: SDR family oxidoreductase [Gammaproteobacteria bacterium]|nr:SDR family oxidoreductase [Gammaproteobacteria bacterium]